MPVERCAWKCGREVVAGSVGTRAVTLGGKSAGTLCPVCAAESRDLETEARGFTAGGVSWT